jgi:Zn-finger nucleic acid-binding protein
MTIIVCPRCGMDHVEPDGLPDVEEEMCPDCAGEEAQGGGSGATGLSA